MVLGIALVVVGCIGVLLSLFVQIYTIREFEKERKELLEDMEKK